MKNETGTIAASIIVAGLIIAGAILVKGGSSSVVSQQQVAQQQQNLNTEAVRPVDENDHVYGSRDAKVFIVEYSDFDCPFCKRFHSTMKQVIDTQENEGEVAWVFRHFPIDSLHPNARYKAHVSECTAEYGGESAFWAIADYFATEGNTQEGMYKVIEGLGINKSDIDACTKNLVHAEKIQDDIKNAGETGGRGTPWSIVIGPDGETYPLSGSLPVSAVQAAIAQALK